MQGKQNLPNMERRGPHKSMHCKFCKPPGVVTPEKSTQAQLETKTKIHLVHEAADLRLYNVHNEPGVPAVESEACICILEGENPCPKCAPDKNRPPPKKKVCRCPKGAKPHPSMYNETTPKKKKPKDEDDEFWWEKYSREHDAIARETWAAYMAQRKKDKKLAKCQKQEQAAMIASKTKGTPNWCQTLSCQQMMYIEFLSTAIRLDSDENITDRTYFILGGIGLYPRPNRKILKRCLRFCHYNAIQFLNQLHMLIKDLDPFKEKDLSPKQGDTYTWNEKLIMNTMCYLEFPALLRELMERLPPLPRERILPQIPYPVFPVLPKKKYSSPYEEPIWQDRLNWVEKKKIDRINRCRAHLETKRVKIPPLALVRRPSLIDARPPFLAQIEANERASRRTRKEEYKKPVRKHQVSTFNSAIDVTAIAGIEASEISTTDKADTDDICVFLREPKPSDSVAGEMDEEPDFQVDKEVKFKEESPKINDSQPNQIKGAADLDEENFVEEAREEIPFKTPPKTESGVTIASPCPPPQTTPGPPATHYEKGKRELGIINQELCNFFPFVSSSTQTVKDSCSVPEEDVEIKLKAAAEKLKEIAGDPPISVKKKLRKKTSKKYKKSKCHKGIAKRRKGKELKNPPVTEDFETTEEENTEKEDDFKAEEEANEPEDVMQFQQEIKTIKKKKSFIKDSEQSDTDPDTDDEWSTRAPCTPEPPQRDERPTPRRKHRRTKRNRKLLRRAKNKKLGEKTALDEETGEYIKKKVEPRKVDTIGNDEKLQEDKNKTEKEEQTVEVFQGNVQALIAEIIQDLAEEGFHCAAYPVLVKHPDIEQLIAYLKGEIVTDKLRSELRAITKERWNQMKGLTKFPIAELGISQKKMKKADWNDKNWISKLAKWKTNQFYFKVASGRAVASQQLYETLYQSYFGTERYLKAFYAYMTSKFEDAILRGIF